MKWGWCVACVACVACVGCTTPPTTFEAKAGMRVPLPPGWEATPSTDGLSIGPSGHIVAQLEPSTRAFPGPTSLAQVLERERATITKRESTADFVAAAYKTGDARGFLGVKLVGSRTIWCASTAGISENDLDAAWKVCAGVERE